jgi:hypothetical protein
MFNERRPLNMKENKNHTFRFPRYATSRMDFCRAFLSKRHFVSESTSTICRARSHCEGFGRGLFSTQLGQP